MGKKYTIKFCDKVLDPVHGFIDVTEVESKLIELPIFKRMQNIKQLSLTNWIFPGAEHTRYIHSLGVMYIADLMAKQLGYSDEDRQLVRLAGLLHDIGHYPLSHVTESVYLDELVRTDDILEKHNEKVQKKIDELCVPESPKNMVSRYNKKRHHEAVGALVIRNDSDIQRIIQQYCPFIKIDDICDIIVGCVENRKISGLVQLIHSELDADGIDYVMRDSTFSGTCYGGFELGMLIRNLTRRKVNGVEIVGIKPKGVAIADQYLISKYFSYTQIVFNKHVSILETMAEFLTYEMIKNSNIAYPSREDLLEYVKEHNIDSFYLSFTDTLFWAHIKDVIEHKAITKKQYLLNMAEKLLNYEELPVRNNEFIITSNDRKRVQKELKKTQIYKELASKSEALVLFQEKGFTNQVPEKEFVKLLNTLRAGKCSQEELKKEKIKRMQEGVMVIEDGKPIKALVDSPTSVMSHLYGTKTYILRQYDI